MRFISGRPTNSTRCGLQRCERSWLARLVAIAVTASAALAVAIPAAGAAAVEQINPARVNEIAALLPSRPAGLGQPLSDRAAWEALARSTGFALVVPEAQQLVQRPTPDLPPDLYLDYSRTGNRDRCQRVMFERSERLATLTVAECLENRGRFIQPLGETIIALCNEPTWVLPAHDGQLNNFYGRAMEPDLRATRVAWELATADFLLGDRLPEPIRRMIREQTQLRVLRPFSDMVLGRRPAMHWLRATHNWNAVCLAGTTGTALALIESPQERAWYVAAAEQLIQNFLRGFTPDGYCSEGLGYWNYGFGHFVMLGETIRQATAGRLDWLANPVALQPALFGVRSEILNGVYLAVADASPGAQPQPQLTRYLQERLELPASGVGTEVFLRSSRSLVDTAFYTFLRRPLPVAQRATSDGESRVRTWFKDGGVLICRTAAEDGAEFAAALKGGHNAEHHNHNDVGSFSVVAGRTMILCDPGAETYTARTFSAKRYESQVLNSFGHSVPLVAGRMQRAGADARAVVLKTDFSDEADTLALDLQSAYAVPELTQLQRTFVFRRGPSPSLTVRDEVRFKKAEAFETALITWGRWEKQSKDEWRVSDGADAVRVKVDAAGLALKVSETTLAEDVRTPRKPVRTGFAVAAPVKEARITLTITPDRSPAQR